MFKVVLVGKPNVGKSTIFNRLIGHKKAIVSDQAGTTRDRNYDYCNWLTKTFQIIDSGGMLNNLALPFQEAINLQVNFAIDEAHLILFIIDGQQGINQDDRYVAKILKKYPHKKVLLVVNKAENNNYEKHNEYLNLKFGNCYYISAEHGIGIGDLLDKVVSFIPKDQSLIEDKTIKFCVIGKPNVGKSSLVNSLLQQERVIVSSQQNTTRDSIDCHFQRDNQPYTIIDTAGIRRKGKIQQEIDKASYSRCQLAIKRSQFIVLVLDGTKEIDQQDQTIGGLACQANIPCLILVNKIDQWQDKQEEMKKITLMIRKEFKYLVWAPIVFVSAQEKKNLATIFAKMKMINQQLQTKVSTSLLNSVLEKAQALNPPMQFKGGRISISYATQVNSQIPTFVLFCNNPKFVHFTYARYIENQIRQAFNLTCVPILVYYKDKNSRIRGVD